MARIERLLSINMAVLAVLGTTLLGMGQLDFLLPLLVLAAAVCSVYFTDQKRVFYLNRHVANIAALIAVGFSLFDFADADRNEQLLAIANLLVYLQVVVLFQEKNARIYWQLAMLSLLQVVVAAALNYSVLFGLLLVLYMFVGLATLALFYIYREASRVSPTGDAPARTPAADLTRPAATSAPQSATPGSSTASTATSSTGSLVARRWPVAAVPLAFSGTDSSELGAATTNRQLVRTTSNMALATLGLTAIMFVTVPRFGNDPWRGDGTLVGRSVGFSDEVTLGALGEIENNSQLVMRVKFVDEETGEDFRLRGMPLWRGSVKTEYSPETKQWTSDPSFNSYIDDLRSPPQLEPNLIRQEITLEPLNEPVVFSIFPVYARSPKSHPIKYDGNRKYIFRPEQMKRTQMNFDLYTNSIARADEAGVTTYRQQRFYPERSRLANYDLNRMFLMPPTPKGGVDPFAGLRSVAAKAAQDAGASPEDHFKVAEALESFLTSKGGFEYSMTGQSRPDGVDPIEDFVTNGRKGHCEYFASALTLMLRSMNIPARMVIGFKGGEWNGFGSYYQVRQLHCHAWVEVYLSEEQLEKYGHEFHGYTHGAWLTLDPTTDEMAGVNEDRAGLFRQISATLDYVEMLWVTYVVGLTKKQQEENIYSPIAGFYSGVGDWIRDRLPGGGEGPLGLFGLFQWLGDNFFSLRGFLATIILATIVYALVYLTRLGWRKVRRLIRPDEAERRAADEQRVEFYRRLETMLAPHGFRRLEVQTQREFATAAGGQLAEQPQLRHAAPLPRGIVDAFYQVRFGNRALDSGQVEAVEQALTELEASLSQPPNGNGHAPDGNGHASNGNAL